jgi:hypothetical protein
MKGRLFFAAVLLCCSAGLTFSFDFGLLLDQQFQTEQGIGAEAATFSYNPALSPWFSWAGDRGLSLYLSGVFSLEYHRTNDGRDDNDGWDKPVLVPEISRFALTYGIDRRFFVETGRIFYADVLGLAASGLFDGFRVELILPFGSLSAGAWYTGLLYKKTAEILMTAADTREYAESWAWDDPGAYFASRRALMSLRGEIFLDVSRTLSFEALAQFDLSGEEDTLHSQYGEIKVDILSRRNAGITLGLLFEVMEKGSEDLGFALGALTRFETGIPGSLNDRFTVNCILTSGPWNDTFVAFTPLNSHAQGKIFTEPFSGLGLISADYEARLHRTLFIDGAWRYFLRTFNGDEAGTGDEGFLYGGELWVSLAWQPLDDLRLSLGGGAFFPRLGNIYPSGSGAAWKIAAALTLSL